MMEQPAQLAKVTTGCHGYLTVFCQIAVKYCDGALSNGRILAWGVSFDKKTLSLKGLERLLSELL